MRDCYEILQVERDCSFEELKRAFRAAAMHCHPDRFGNAPDKTLAFQELAAAFDTLSDPGKRRRYDAERLDSFEQMARAPEAKGEESGWILDCEASDILEELIVGNRDLPETSLATLLSDLTKTDVFIAYREGKNAAAAGQYRAAVSSFFYAVGCAPRNIVFRVHLARALRALGQTRKARYHYNCAIAVGESRVPRQSMANVRFELAELNRASRSWLARWFGFGGGPVRPKWCEDAGDAMCEELARCIGRAARRELAAERAEERKKLGK